MRPIVLIVMLVVALLASATGCVGYRVAGLAPEPGERVRFTSEEPDLREYDGTLVALSPDTLVVDSLRVALASVQRLDVHGGYRSRRLRGAGIGFGIGAVIGASGGATCKEPGYCDNRAAAILAGAGIAGAVGALFGMVIGAFDIRVRWEEVPLDRPRVSFVPQRDGRFGLGLSVRF